MMNSYTQHESLGQSLSIMTSRLKLTLLGDGFLPDFVLEELRGLELIEQLFVLKRCMSEKIRYEKGKVTVLREKQRGMTLGEAFKRYR